jgi:hypothetical protein
MYRTVPSFFATAESVPENTHELRALDASEQEYNRMISQHSSYHRMMMDDLMKLSTESGSANTAAAHDPNGIVTGLGTTVANLNASNERLLQSTANRAEQSKQRAATASNLNAYMQKMGLKLQGDIDAYDTIMSNSRREGFDTMDAALEVSEIVSESQKYAFFIFGAFAIFLLYKTAKQL